MNFLNYTTLQKSQPAVIHLESNDRDYMKLLAELFEKKYGLLPDKIVPLRSDGSDRKIYRVFSGRDTVIGIIGNNYDENAAFLSFSNHFRKRGLRVPEIFIQDLEAGAYLEEDLGDDTLFLWMMKIRDQHGLTEQVKEMYRQVIKYLPKFQISEGRNVDYSLCYQHDEFGEESMLWDLNYFKHRFLDEFYKLPMDRAALETDFNTLTSFLLEEDRIFFLYRDFQSRNVMIKNNLPYFIDYQSGRHGALQYDVASLLYDAKADLPESFREELIHIYLEEVQKYADVNSDRFLKYFYGFVLIRIMQAFGAYGYLSVVKKKKHFFKSVPFAISNLKILLDKKLPILEKLPVLRKVYSNLVSDESLTKFERDDD